MEEQESASGDRRYEAPTLTELGTVAGLTGDEPDSVQPDEPIRP